ncbi:uncharacterized protein [Zea mays]|uniref:uncharacterized protein n=1 Tax=Zea mays TaxID=4577 RepID=UPI0004DEAA0C|nr:uncharacterized protein LOC103637991 [Zea mays]|eukprot:XP_008659213.1 uncharacterized protein LOC103637991 [Zea mays]
MSRSRFFAWTLAVAVAVLLWSYCAARAVCSSSSRPLAAADDGGGARDDEPEPCAAGGAASRGQREIWNSRRSLGGRSWWSPPSPLWNSPRTMPVPPPPQV